MSETIKSSKRRARGGESKAHQKPGTTQDRRTRLLEVGEELFAHQRYEDVAAGDITDRAGVAHGLLFHYFGSKRRFYFAVLQHSAQRGRDRFTGNTISDPKRWIRKELDLYLEGVVEEEQAFATLIHGSLGAEQEARDIMNGERNAAVDRVLAKLAPERGSILLTMVIGAWVSMANDLSAQWVESGRKVPKKHIHSVLLASLNDMLKAAAVDPRARFDPDCFR